ncbi:PLD nuclease N-terminal domain-containing protein [Salinibacillus xinjiangensis]|uniref:Transcriptional regulator n=1 Tax=Salinibacillus xinjiangensis TaxID=1229268 RepID=A0A6G1X936_9BACI|nr:PLD nuclease N-terminal domain-containing protein [Salinibacillus xinjiangensis]MRG87521.1 transcriptional regulator [Salinibacillus xinjiangensis]
MGLEDINWALIAPLIIVEMILLAVALIDLIRIEETNGPKWVWAVICIFISLIGPVLYFIFGRRQ